MSRNPPIQVGKLKFTYRERNGQACVYTKGRGPKRLELWLYHDGRGCSAFYGENSTWASGADPREALTTLIAKLIDWERHRHAKAIAALEKLLP